MWRSRLINRAIYGAEPSARRKDAISTFVQKKDEKCNKIFFLLIAWFGARGAVCVQRLISMVIDSERDRDKSYGTSLCSCSGRRLPLFDVIRGRLQPAAAEQKASSAWQLRRTPHIINLFECGKGAFTPYWLWYFLSLMICQKFFFSRKLRAFRLPSIVSRGESLLFSVLAYLFATQPTNKSVILCTMPKSWWRI